MLETNRIYNSDCIEGMKQIECGGVDLIVSDPPYCIAYKTGWRKEDHRFAKEILNDDNEQLVVDYMKECYRILKDNSAAYIFCSAKTLDFFMQQAREAGFAIKNVLIWRKNNHTAGDLEAQYGQYIGKDLNEILEEFDGCEPPEIEYGGVTYGDAVRKSDDVYGILVSFKRTKYMTVNACCHEASHACDAIESTIDMEHGGEASAYLIGWIAECINKARQGKGDFVEFKGK